MIIIAILGFIPVCEATSLAIGHFMGIWWQVAAVPLLGCLGAWYGLVTARCSRG